MRHQQRLRKPETLERIRRLIAGAEEGPFFAWIAEAVAARRPELGLSQQQPATPTGTTRTAIARLETGGPPPRFDTLLRIAGALDRDLVVDPQPRGEHGRGPAA